MNLNLTGIHLEITPAIRAYVVAERRRDRDVMSADGEIHARLLRPQTSKSFSHADRGDLQRLAVLGDGAAGDHDALLRQYL